MKLKPIKKCLPFSLVVEGETTRYVNGMDPDDYGIVRYDRINTTTKGEVTGLVYDSHGQYRSFSMPVEVFQNLRVKAS